MTIEAFTRNPRETETSRRRLPHVKMTFFFIMSIPFILAAWNHQAIASPEFSGQSKLACSACHIHPDGGSALTFRGERFKADGYTLLPDEGRHLWVKRLARTVLGFLHILFGVIWFGSIIYVHLVIKPRSLVAGMPKSEKFLGRLCIGVVGLTGIGLTLLKIQEVRELWSTTFGIIWIVKVGTYFLMVVVAAVATTYIDRKLREAAGRDGALKPDGKEGRPAHIIHSGRLYDVTGSKFWKNGVHMARHFAGTDLTDALEKAPHSLEVFERVKDLGTAPAADEKDRGKNVLNLFVFLAYFILVCVLVVLTCIVWWRWGPPLVDPFPKWTRGKANACLKCHNLETPAVLADWSESAHAKNGVSCMHCHLASKSDPDISNFHKKHGKAWVSPVVTPKDCSRCHLDRNQEFQRSKHAKTVAIVLSTDPFIRENRLSDVEIVTGCEGCHGVGISDGSARLEQLRGLPRGIGRMNSDRSFGNCGACHGPHSFAVSQARRAEACGKCHVGPEHPQMEIYRESKHGTLYQVFGDAWRWEPAASTWTAGVDYRSPTCAACHISGAGNTPPSHDVGHRLSWELQASPTGRPEGIDWKEARGRMETVCLQCHSLLWTRNHFDQLDRAVHEYNEVYGGPVRRYMERLYRENILDKTRLTDEQLEIAWIEMGHREGRAAKMGAAMMAPDYRWWHGLYELKKRFVALMEAH